jgi:hypothetical protein
VKRRERIVVSDPCNTACVAYRASIETARWKPKAATSSHAEGRGLVRTR